MAQEHKPMQLDADVEYRKTRRAAEAPKAEKKALPWLLGVLVLLGIYAVIDSTSGGGVQSELTPEQQQIQETVSRTVREYVEENGVPENPEELDLPEGSDIVLNEDGSWIVSTSDGQLISSPGALTPR